MDQWNTRKWSKWANALFKKERPLGSEPWFNPEAVTEQKREWIEQQQKTQGVEDATWPEHIYENFFIVGLPPDMELTQVAEQLCELERKKQRGDSDIDTEPGKERLQPPQPSFTPQVLFRAPPGAPAPVSDDELAAFCFPAGVAPEKLKRTPSLSALDELVMGRDSDQQQQCFVFMLKVGGNFPLYGCCWYVREMLHRPPYLAKQQYRSCRAPFRQCMIAAPRCYCLLSHYPFFDLHFKVLKIVLDLERLERLLEYDSEKSKLRPPGPNLLAPSSPKAHSGAAAAAAPAGSRRSLQDSYSTGGSASGSLASSRAPSPVFGTRSSRASAAGTVQVVVSSSTGGAPPAAVDAGSMGRAAASSEGGSGQVLGPPVRRQTPDSDVQPHVVHNRQLYCLECAGIMEEMCPFTPGAMEAQALPLWSHWQQRRRANSPLGAEGNDAFSPGLQQQDDSSRDKLHVSPISTLLDHSTPSVAVGIPMQCEVCRKRLRMSTPDGQPEGSTLSAAAAPTAPASAAGGGAAVAATVADSDAAASGIKAVQVQPTLISALAGVLPARLSAVLQSSSSAGGQDSTAAATTPKTEQQQQQQQAPAVSAEAAVQFDAVAAAAADFDAASGPASTVQQPEQWAKWQDVVAAVRGPQGQPEQQQQQQQQQAHDGVGSVPPSQEASASAAASASVSVPETSMVQRMWETWAPKALEGSSSADAAAAGNNTARLSGGLGLFKRSSRASGGLSEQQAAVHSSRASLPSAGQGSEGQETQPMAEGLLQPLHAQDEPQQPSALRHSQQQQQQHDHGTSAVQDGQAGIEQQQQTAGHSIQQHQQQQQHQQGGSGHSHSYAHSAHGPSRLRPDPAHAVAEQHESGTAAADARVTDAELWSLDPNLRALSSYKGHGGGANLAHLTGAGPEGLRDISTTSNVSFYSVEDAVAGSSTADAQQGRTSLDGLPQQLGVQPEQEGHQQVLQQQHQQSQLQQAGHSKSAGCLPQQQQQQQQQQPQQQKQLLGQRGKSEVLLRRQPSPPPGQQTPLVQLQGRRQQRWSDPASWPSRPRTPSPLPLVNRVSQGGRAVAGCTGADGLVSAFAAIAAAAEPFDAALPLPGTRPSTGNSLNAGELGSVSSVDSGLPSAGAAASGGAEGLADSADSSSQGGLGRVNVTIGGGVIPSADSKVQLSLQPPSRTASGSRRSALFEEVALRRSGDMSSELRMTISHLVQVDSSTLLAAYYASPVPQPGETYHLLLGDLYRLEFERCLPLQQYAPPGRSRLRQQVLTYAEVECAQHLQLWTVAALCRSLSVDNIITLVNAALLEKQLVVFCPHIGTLGSVVLSLVPLLRPFTWQSLVMPVTPVSMLGFLDAPVPFVLGVQYKTPDVASRCHGLMRVNVYKDAIKNASFPSLPNTRQLAAALAPHHVALCDAAPLAVERPVHVITPDEEEAAQAFLGVMHDYLSKLCGDLRLHTIVNVGMSKRTGIFMKESLLESMPAKDRPFMRSFMETQMFAAYADGVISDYCES